MYGSSSTPTIIVAVYRLTACKPRMPNIQYTLSAAGVAKDSRLAASSPHVHLLIVRTLRTKAEPLKVNNRLTGPMGYSQLWTSLDTTN